MEKITQKDIADVLGVSVVTVSNALSGKKGVSEELRSRILDKAAELGMSAGRYGGKTQEAFTIGIYVSGWYISVGTSFYWELYQKTAYAASRRRCFSMLEIGDKEHDEELPRLLASGKIDGLILIGKVKEQLLRKIVDLAGIPVVLLDFYAPGLGCDAVLSENYAGMYRATECLAEAGYRKIGFVGDFGIFRNGVERFFGYRKCLLERGLVYDPDYILTENTLPNGDIAVKLPEKLPEAFACGSDFLAYFVVEELRKRGLTVPDDISIASYDHDLQKKFPFGELTAYEVDLDKMARTAVKRLIRRMKGDSGAPQTRYVEGRMFFGDSIRPLCP